MRAHFTRVLGGVAATMTCTAALLPAIARAFSGPPDAVPSFSGCPSGVAAASGRGARAVRLLRPGAYSLPARCGRQLWGGLPITAEPAR